MDEKDGEIAKIADLIKLCDNRNLAQFSYFYDEYFVEQAKKIADESSMNESEIYGGYKEAERKMLGIFPPWIEKNTDDFPIDIIRVDIKYAKKLSHRDFLGTIMSLGIERNRIGDIIVFDNVAYIFAHNTISHYIVRNITKISNVGVKLAIENRDSVVIPEKSFEILDLIITSDRLDCLVSAIAKVSRSKAEELLKKEKVSVNHVVRTDNKKISIKSTISIRGYGRYVYFEQCGNTLKGRIHIKVKKYT